MSRLELRVSIAAFLAGTVVLGAVVCAAYGLTIVASAMSIYAEMMAPGTVHNTTAVALMNPIPRASAAKAARRAASARPAPSS